MKTDRFTTLYRGVLAPPTGRAAPHIDIDWLLDSDGARREPLAKVADRGLTISALTCSGNPLHPGPAAASTTRSRAGRSVSPRSSASTEW
ncbi:hypothetical protein KUF83_19660 [Streptomyces sp. BV286]|uniref:hypothetical protein n=1 Tax=Streptomyces sp. BV286 TaxID=2849672 RepID=UPI001C2E8C1D|nr:hypothetical protein [Streptomyces sp. BV286]MBV1938758.1 hypothetical protein [Streptomyces sp. BV286]